MTYELAKQLRDSGFSQTKGARFESSIIKHPAVGMSTIKPDEVYCPTLSELIEACGDGNFRMEKHQYTGVWIATYPHPTDRELITARDLTLEDTVAKLWLMLNKLRDELSEYEQDI